MKIFSCFYQNRLEMQKISPILINWNFKNPKFNELSGGKIQANWLVKNHSKKYVLQNVGSDKQWLDWVIFILHQLSQNDFPYSIPNLISTTQGETYVKHNDSYWWLYEFIEGNTLGYFASDKIQAYQVGVLVAEFHKSICSVNWQHFRLYQLELFHTENIKSNINLIESNINSSNIDGGDLLLAKIYDFWDVYGRIEPKEIEQVQSLNQVPIYYDFHGGNILNINCQITGLIDFDSLAIAPKIVDIQNALFYIASTKEGLNLQKVESFMSGYLSVSTCSLSELMSLPIVMFERLFFLLLRSLCDRGNKFPLQKDAIEYRFMNAMSWIMLDEHKELFLGIDKTR
jgi:Ser/Thr protein kinase RdoA (MazF antagonist)